MQAYLPIHNKLIKLLPSSLKAPERFSTLSFNIPCLITLLSCLIYRTTMLAICCTLPAMQNAAGWADNQECTESR